MPDGCDSLKIQMFAKKLPQILWRSRRWPIGRAAKRAESRMTTKAPGTGCQRFEAFNLVALENRTGEKRPKNEATPDRERAAKLLVSIARSRPR